MYNFIDLLCIIGGGYLVYTGIVMKTKGKIVNNVVMNKGADESALRDKEGFINYLYLKLIIIGAVIMLAGVANIVNDITAQSSIIAAVSSCAFAAAIVVYAVFINKALKKFLKYPR
ncbi:MAG: hypothetical protein NC341_11430 [Blautia sp.]|nr:hypothetical protein [Blautia sp.]MCM1201721.1 hypothetical protein [Bacteroides fragilis]